MSKKSFARRKKPTPIVNLRGWQAARQPWARKMLPVTGVCRSSSSTSHSSSHRRRLRAPVMRCRRQSETPQGTACGSRRKIPNLVKSTGPTTRCRRPPGTPRKAARLYQRLRLRLVPRQRLQVLLLRGGVGASMRRDSTTLTQDTPRGTRRTSRMLAHGDSTQAPTTTTATVQAITRDIRGPTDRRRMEQPSRRRGRRRGTHSNGVSTRHSNGVSTRHTSRLRADRTALTKALPVLTR